MNNKQLRETIAMHLYNRFSPNTDAFGDISRDSQEKWKSEAEDILTITGYPGEDQEAVTLARITGFDWLKFSPSESLPVIKLAVDLKEPDTGIGVRVDRLLRACGVSRETYDSNHDSIINQQVSVRLGIIPDQRSGRNRLRILNYEITSQR